MADSRLHLTTDLNAPGRNIGDLMLKWSDNTVPLGVYPVPVISIRGKPGPVVLVLGGTHGDEFEGPAAILRLAAQLDPSELTGQVILIPALNAPAVHASSRVSPLDGQNLNRAFPGDADGGPTAMLAHFVEAELIPRADAVIDLHSGGKASVFQPCALAARTGNAQLTAANMELARAFGLPLIWVLGAHNDNRSVNSAATRAETPMIAAELGGGGGVDPEVTDLAEAGLMRCLRHLDVLPSGTVDSIPTHCVEIADPTHSLYAPADGLFDRRCTAGQNIEAGASAGTLFFPTEPDRAPINLRFPVSGFVLAHGNRGVVRRGDLLALVAQPVPERS
ncbi:succinylglutamate desuccinylase/aspartoacylase family protein [Rhodobacteraceae bacterium B1Z28]|uniref:Succinylglutamate desuccinylase/aspartoacylase family protein n=1 Tax=Ruegeria haliotis TaxID=2747601 RepID=A0ABX2PW69_9RHOB|nr:succinylglutamate desuccinylase/aspartoacylase family protein [Ruegeria haliotis]NVO58452.1 succinylglutamate desuccinylase/aspartoacylase family protein [Ruegeria haliotis]